MAEPSATQPADGKRVIDRRDFVKRTMQVAAGGAVLAGAAPVVLPLSYNPVKIKRFPYIGARILPPGPAPQGIPIIPVRVNKDGILEGVPEAKGAPVNHNLEWYKYCAHEEAPGLELGFTNDNTLEYFFLQEKVGASRSQGIELWYQNMLGQKIRASDFTQVGMGAPFRWRSEGQEQNNIVTGIIIRIDPASLKGKVFEPFYDKENGFIAFASFCAHFCCVPGYQENNSTLTKFKEGDGHELIYCSCHDSRYDPLDLREYTFPPDF